jgi:SAM-dependent methyltransferase
MAHGAGRYERFIAPRKRDLLGGVRGTVVEIGAGTGVNIEYLSSGGVDRYIAVEPNPCMHPYLRRASEEHGVGMELRAEPFEEAALEAGSADVVLCTLVLCSVADPAAVLARVKRILKPGGRFIFIEHVAAPRGTARRAAQRMVRPVWRTLGDGCNPDRETWMAIEQAGFAGVQYERFAAPLPLVRPHIAGIARTVDGVTNEGEVGA